jgi:hypothetical protein
MTFKMKNWIVARAFNGGVNAMDRPQKRRRCLHFNQFNGYIVIELGGQLDCLAKLTACWRFIESQRLDDDYS